MLSMAATRSSGGIDMLCTSDFVDDVMFAHNGQEQVVLKGRLLSELPGAVPIALFAA